MRRPLTFLLVLCAAAALVVPAAATASTGSDQIIAECANEQLSRPYKQKDYEQALKDLPADLREYTDCADVIKSAQRAAGTQGAGAGPRAVGGGGGTTGGSSGTGGTGGGAATSSASGALPPAATATGDGAGTGTGAPAAGAPAAAAGDAAPAAPAGDPAADQAADQAALDAAQRSGASAVTIGGTTLSPGDPAGVALSLGDLPTPMLVLLGLFGVIALLGLAALVKGWILGLGRKPDPST